MKDWLIYIAVVLVLLLGVYVATRPTNPTPRS